MDGFIWTEEEIRKEIRRMDKITGLNGAALPIQFHKRGRAVGRFCYSKSGKDVFFSFNTTYYTNPTIPREALTDTVRHEYAHYMDYMNRGTSGHGKDWKQCCLVVGALPERYFNMERVWRISDRQLAERKRNELFDNVRAGMAINHPRFGTGVIARIRGVGLNRIAEVRFETLGEKSLGLGWVCDLCLAEPIPAAA